MHAMVEAIGAGDALAARRELATAADDEQRLDVLARLAASGGHGADLATELLIEQLDASRVVHRFAGAALLDQAAVEDVAQDSLISIAQSIGSFQGSGKVTTWVHRIVRNRVVDHLRRQRATSPLPPEGLGPAARMSSIIATRATVQQVLTGLPELYREPVVLRDVEGLPYAEVADRLGRSIGTVKSQVSRGRALVASRLRADAPSEQAADAPPEHEAGAPREHEQDAPREHEAGAPRQYEPGASRQQDAQGVREQIAESTLRRAPGPLERGDE